MDTFNKQICTDEVIAEMKRDAEVAFKRILRQKMDNIIAAQVQLTSALKNLGDKKKELKELEYSEPDFSGISAEDTV